MSSIPGNTSTSETLDPGEVVNLTIDTAGDFDWFRVSLTSGLSYGFLVQSNGGPSIGAPDPDIYLYDNAGTQIVSGGNSSSSSSFITFNTVTTGNYFVGVGDSFDTGAYRLSWIATDNILNNTFTTRTLTSGTAVNSTIDVAGDQDWFKVTLDAGLTYGFLVESRGGPGIGAPDPDIYLHDAIGNQIVSGGNSSSATSFITYSATADGTFFVNVTDSFDNGQYKVTFLGADNIVNNTSTTRVLDRDTSITSTVNVAGDQDVFRVTLQEGISYAFSAARAASSGLPDPDIYVWDANGNRIVSGGNSGSAVSTIGFTPTTGGTYYVEVTDAFDFGRYVVTNIGEDIVRNDTDTSRSLRDGTSAGGTINCNGDSDWVKFGAQQGVTYTFRLEGTGSSTELDNTRLIVRDANGNTVASGFGPATVVTYTATADSNLFLDIQGQSFDDIGGYRVSVVSTAPTLNGTSGADTLTGGANNTVINGDGGSDSLRGGDGKDKLFGSTGNDTLRGEGGDDSLSGGSGTDSLSGGSSNDRLTGGTGNDILRGGTSGDRFVFASGDGSDTIRDWQDGSDRIEITSGATRLSDLSIRQSGDDVRITFGSNVILVENAIRSEFTAGDFVFS
jgi:serralysin